MESRRGIALVLTSALLVLLVLLGVSFLHLSGWERGRSGQMVHEARASLLARSGVAFGCSRLVRDPFVRSGPREAADDWTYRDSSSVPLERSQNPSYASGEGYDDAPPGDGRYRAGTDVFLASHDRNGSGAREAYSGRLRGSHGTHGDTFALRIEAADAKVCVNAGDPAAGAGDADADGIPDMRDPDGPQGWLVRTLDNLDRVTGGPGELGSGAAGILASRPAGGYLTVAQLRGAVPPARWTTLAPFLTLHGRADPKTIRPKPLGERPYRSFTNWNRTSAHTLNGPSHGIDLNGDGTVDWGDGEPVYAWKDLNPGVLVDTPQADVDGDPATVRPFEWRVAVHMNSASAEVLAATFLGLRGIYLHDTVTNLAQGNLVAANIGGLGHYVNRIPCHLDQGPTVLGMGFKNTYPYDCGRIGLVRHTGAITPEQARAIADALIDFRQGRDPQGWFADLAGGWPAQAGIRIGPVRTWMQFDAFVARLPLDEETLAAGEGYRVPAAPLDAFEYGEDVNGNGLLDRGMFPGPDGILGGSGAGDDVPGLTVFQKDVLRAMANPNTDLNDTNPDSLVFKHVDKSDLLDHTTELSPEPAGIFEIASRGDVRGGAGAGLMARRIVATTMDLYRLHRETTQRDFLEGTTFAGGSPDSDRISADLGPASRPATGGRALQTYPEPLQPWLGAGAGIHATRADADGQVALATVEPPAVALCHLHAHYGIQGLDPDLSTAAAPGLLPDHEGPFVGALLHEPGVAGAPQEPGALRPDGAYSENHASLLYEIPENGIWDFEAEGTVMFWFKPHWDPTTTQKLRNLFSAGRFAFWEDSERWVYQHFDVLFVPGPGCLDGTATPYTTGNFQWDPRVLGFGIFTKPNSNVASVTETYRATRCLNHHGHRDGVLGHVPGPRGPLDGHRWIHVAYSWRNGSEPVTEIRINGALAATNTFSDLTGQIVLDFNRRLDARNMADLPNRMAFGVRASNQHIETVAPIRDTGITSVLGSNQTADGTFDEIQALPVLGAGGAVLEQWLDGRYYREGGGSEGTFRSLPRTYEPGGRVLAVQWTSLLPNLAESAVDVDGNGTIAVADNDVSGDGRSDLRIEVGLFEDVAGTPSNPDDDVPLGPRFGGPQGRNLVGREPRGAVHYRAYFVNDWTVPVRDNTPLVQSPYLDDVTLLVTRPRPMILGWTLD